MGAGKRGHEICIKYQQWNGDQKIIFEELMSMLLQRGRRSEFPAPNGKLFLLQERSGSRQIYTLSLLWDFAEHQGVLVQIIAANDITVPLYQIGRTVHSFSKIGVDNEYTSHDSGSSRTSKFDQSFQKAELLLKSVLFIFYEAFTMEYKLFYLFNAILKHVRCSATSKLRPGFGGITVVFAGNYHQPLHVVPSCCPLEYEYGNRQHVNLHLLYPLPYALSP